MSGTQACKVGVCGKVNIWICCNGKIICICICIQIKPNVCGVYTGNLFKNVYKNVILFLS